MRTRAGRALASLERLAEPAARRSRALRPRARGLRRARDRLAADRRPRPRRVPLRLHPVPRLASASAVVDAVPDAGDADRRRHRTRRRAAAGLPSPCSPCSSPGRSSPGPRRLVRSVRGLHCSSPVALLVYPAYGLMFHELSSEPLFAAAFALWAWLVTRAAGQPSPRRFALVGLGVALLALIRPGNAVLLAFAVFPFVLPGDWRDPHEMGRRVSRRRRRPARRLGGAERRRVSATTRSRAAAMQSSRSTARSSATRSCRRTTAPPRASSRRRSSSIC